MIRLSHAPRRQGLKATATSEVPVSVGSDTVVTVVWLVKRPTGGRLLPHEGGCPPYFILYSDKYDNPVRPLQNGHFSRRGSSRLSRSRPLFRKIRALFGGRVRIPRVLSVAGPGALFLRPLIQATP